MKTRSKHTAKHQNNLKSSLAIPELISMLNRRLGVIASVFMSAFLLSGCGLYLKGEASGINTGSSELSKPETRAQNKPLNFNLKAKGSSQLAEALDFYLDSPSGDQQPTNETPSLTIIIMSEKMDSHSNFASQSDTEKRRLSLSVSWGLSIQLGEKNITRHYDLIRDAYFDYSKDQPLANEKERQYVERELVERLAKQIYDQATRQAPLLIKELETPCHETEVAAITTNTCSRS